VNVGDVQRIGEAARLGDRYEIDAGMGVARLHAGFAIVLVVEHDDHEIFRLLDADRGEAAEPHQGLAVAGEHEHAALRFRQREAEPDHGGAAHGTPEIKIERMIAAGSDIVGGRAEPGDDQQIAAIRQQGFDEFAPVEHHLPHTLRPINRCDSRIATC